MNKNYYPSAHKVRTDCRDKLWGIHKETSSKKHAIERETGRVNWKEFNPTQFMYVYFTFNSLYSINWAQSLQSGFEYYRDNGEYPQISERSQFNNMIDICLENQGFNKLYIPIFREVVLSKHKLTEIYDILNTLHTGGNAPIDEDIIFKFKESLRKVLEQGRAYSSDIKKIAFFIHKVRCNIFHGSKTLADMNKLEQKQRLLLYTNILIAINQMIFSYLDFLCGEEDSSKELLEQISATFR